MKIIMTLLTALIITLNFSLPCLAVTTADVKSETDKKKTEEELLEEKIQKVLEKRLRKMADGHPTLYFNKNAKMKFGLRQQWRYFYDEATSQNDFMIRRTRLKTEGSLLKDTEFKCELKIDHAGEEGRDQEVQVEDISLFLNLWGPQFRIRIGLHDAPLSRNQMTSDGKLMFMEYSDIVEKGYKSEGLADNVYGATFYGLVKERLEYHVGLYDSAKWDAESSELMPMVRLVFHCLDPITDVRAGEYKESYHGDGKNHFNLGFSAGLLNKIITGGDMYNVRGAEIDLLLSLKCGLTIQAEGGRVVRQQFVSGAPDVESAGWYAQTGYTLPKKIGPGKLEIAYRIQGFDDDVETSGGRVVKTSVGLNYYILGHNMKIQTDYTFADRQTGDNDGQFRLQFQIDF